VGATVGAGVGLLVGVYVKRVDVETFMMEYPASELRRPLMKSSSSREANSLPASTPPAILISMMALPDSRVALIDEVGMSR
jgi:hypothetical protein